MNSSNKKLELCKIIYCENYDEEVFVVDSIEYCYDTIDSDEVEVLTGEFAGTTLKKIDSKLEKTVKNEKSVYCWTENVESLKNHFATSDIDEIRDNLYSYIVGEKFIRDKKTNKLRPLNLEEKTSNYEKLSVESFKEKENEEKKSNKKSLTNKSKQLSVLDMENKIKKSIIGQNEAIRTIVTSIYANQKVLNSDLTPEQKMQLKKNILIVGKTGTGKTEILRQVSKLINLPINIEDATRYTIAGYVGESVEDMLLNLIKRANGNIEKAERGILVIDEIDKKRVGGEGNSGIATDGVQFSLLKIIEGGKFEIEESYYNKITFDTSKLTVVLAGAFSDMFENPEKVNSLGFGSSSTTKNISKKLEPEDFIKFGMVPEIMGRISTIVQMNDFKLDDYKQIIRKSALSPIILKRLFLKSQGVDLRVEDAFITALAEETMKLNIGARGIKMVLDKMIGDLDFDVLKGDISKVQFNKTGIVKVRKNNN